MHRGVAAKKASMSLDKKNQKGTRGSNMRFKGKT